jgi:hypothetical protein
MVDTSWTKESAVSTAFDSSKNLPGAYYLLLETGGKLLLETGGGIYLENCSDYSTTYTKQSVTNTIWI